MNRPVEISKHVTLAFNEKIDEKDLGKIIRAIFDNLPFGVATSASTTCSDGSLRSFRFLCRERQGTFQYVVPLTRDLSEDEASTLAQALDAIIEKDFDLDATCSVINSVMRKIKKDEASTPYGDLALTLAKSDHERWYNEKAKAGWAYGAEIDVDNKKHPLMRPWSELPDEYKAIDFERPDEISKMFDHHGYAVVAKSDLEAVERLLRSIK